MNRTRPIDTPGDLNALVNAASDEVGRARRQPALPRGESDERRPVAFWIAGVAAMSIALALNWHDLRQLAGAAVPGAEAAKERRTFEEILSRAQAEVEAERAATGRIPARVPRAALAALVDYRPGADDYRLAIDTGATTLVMDRYGNITETPSRR